ncbi:MAG: hypothetical protein ACP5OA_01615 [Candidatus Woesearchaeota archaeon]
MSVKLFRYLLLIILALNVTLVSVDIVNATCYISRDSCGTTKPTTEFITIENNSLYPANSLCYSDYAWVYSEGVIATQCVKDCCCDSTNQIGYWPMTRGFCTYNKYIPQAGAKDQASCTALCSLSNTSDRYNFSGYVFNGKTPVSGVPVTLNDGSSSTTNDNGWFTFFDVNPGSVSISATIGACTGVQSFILNKNNQEQNIYINCPIAKLSGIVTEGNNDGLAGITITATDGTTVYITTSNDRGYYELNIPSGAIITLNASNAGCSYEKIINIDRVNVTENIYILCNDNNRTLCGNGHIDTGEECDDGSLNTDKACNAFSASCKYCDTYCKYHALECKNGTVRSEKRSIANGIAERDAICADNIWVWYNISYSCYRNYTLCKDSCYLTERPCADSITSAVSGIQSGYCSNNVWNYGNCTTEKRYTCTDSDHGLDWYISGTANSTAGGSWTDICQNDNYGILEAANSRILYEAFCTSDDGNVDIESYDCPYGCKDGACINLPRINNTPRIAYWYGKVNQHINITTGTWETDPDGISGADIDILTYCRKWYPNTVDVTEYNIEYISGWRERGNVNYYNSTKQTYKCIVNASLCGNRVLDPGEECDGYVINNNMTCKSFDFTEGSLSCQKDCTFNFRNCTNSTKETNKCIDSDGGRNYYEKGNISGPELTTGESPIDYCTTYGSYSLVEYFCSEDSLNSESYICENENRTCIDGACVPNSSICPQYSAPPPEWCENGTIIDGGKDSMGCMNPPICDFSACKSGYSLCNDRCYSNSQFCTMANGFGSQSGYCSNDVWNWYVCSPISCNSRYFIGEGKCIPATNITTFSCEDSDNGINTSTYGTITSTNPATGAIMNNTDYCYDLTLYNNQNIGMTKSCKGDNCAIDEYYCQVINGRLTSGLTLVPCPNGCDDGACNSQSDENKISETICTDSDGGADYYFKGTVNSTIRGSWTDTCQNDNYETTSSENNGSSILSRTQSILYEGICTNESIEVKKYTCPNGCNNGGCIKNSSSITDQPLCIESWKCSDWSTCLNSTMTRICEDTSNCTTELHKPSVKDSCDSCSNRIKDENEIDIDCGGSCTPCVVIPKIPIGPNLKDMSLYSDKGVFLISDADWKSVLSLVPVTTWTGNEMCNKGYNTANNVCIYPTLIDHEEEHYGKKVFDADSIIYFMQQYDAEKITIIGKTPQDLDNLLVAEADLGAGISASNINRIYPWNYLSYWKSYNNIVYVKDDYESALIASAYSSLLGAPLIIQGTELDVDSVFENRTVICVGDVQRNCNEKYSIKQLQQEYLQKTDTDKLILVNPKDLDMVIRGSLSMKKSSGYSNNLYSKTSLISPILASAKHELILTSSIASPNVLASFINTFSSNLGMNARYLTIIASPNAIEYKQYGWDTADNWFERGDQQTDIYISLDQNLYAINGNNYRYTGRIMGLTLSDISGYLARDLFYDSISNSENVLFMASSYDTSDIVDHMEEVKKFISEFTNSGYKVTSKMLYHSNNFDVELWSRYNYNLIFYRDHGSRAWLGIYYKDIPKLDNAFVIGDACSTVSTNGSSSFWAHVIRQGGIGYIGAVSVAFTTAAPVYDDTIYGVYSSGSTIGKALGESYKDNVFDKSNFREKRSYMVTLVGDPTLDINPPHRLIRNR